jgi:hypothetical protein
MDAKSIGIVVVAAGCLLALVGLAVYFGLLSWFGRLPGDVRIEGEHVRVYVPITSMLLLSVALSLIAYVARRLF